MKKVLLVLIAIITCFIITGCSTKTVEGNKAFGKYTGIYKLKNMEIRIVHYKETLMLTLKRDGNPYGNTTIYLEGNKFEDLDCEFELKKNILNVKSRQKEIPSGKYKRTKEYTTEEIYEDYIGDISYINKNNGIYENDIAKIHIIRTSYDIVRFAYKHKDSITNLAANKVSDNEFNIDLFGDEYELIFNDETLEFKADCDEENEKELTGIYTKKDEMKAADIIKVFVFEDYE